MMIPIDIAISLLQEKVSLLEAIIAEMTKTIAYKDETIAHLKESVEIQATMLRRYHGALGLHQR